MSRRRRSSANPPDDIREVLDRLFIIRENREQILSGERLRAFSELLGDIPSSSGRVDVLRQLAESFQNVPHYWAHYGRALSYEVGDSEGAVRAINRALSLDDRDSVLFHIRGMVYRQQLRSLAQPTSPSDEELQRITQLPLDDFAEAARLDDDSEYPYVATVQVAVLAIETGFKHSGSKTFAEFLARPASVVYRGYLERTEAAVDAISEIRGADPMSARAEEAINSINGIYDDYSALLRGGATCLIVVT